MSVSPTHTITFLFTDIEGSTVLWEQYPQAMRTALERHHALLRATIEARHGRIFNVAGDGLCAAFATAADALAAALAAQRALYQTDWGQTPIRVRMGLHTGAAEVDTDGYHSGPTLNRVARIMTSAHGGQVLLSQTTADLLHGQLPSGVILRDVGWHRLKGLAEAEHLYQVVTADLPSAFPALRSASSTPNNLPVQLTSFIGRERELAELHRLLTSTRLLTLTGSGGTGKTRLSLQMADEVLNQFRDGVWLVELAPLSEPYLITQAVVAALGLREQPGRALRETLTDYLRDKQLLLILDNCEHLIEAGARLADTLLHAAPQLKIVASSREGLGIAGETTYHVPSLPIPNLKGDLSFANLATLDSVRLFVERAAAAKTDFALTGTNAPAIAQICSRLDGIPLALELAAARVKSLPVETIAARLDDRFRLLTGGSRTALPRQQTLRGAIDWSYSLLTEPERVLLRRLSVFAGGWTLEAAEAVCGDEATTDGRTRPGGAVRRTTEAVADERHGRPSAVIALPSADVLDMLTRLADKSLVVLDEQAIEPRYRMLETIRQYANEKLIDAGEAEHIRDLHLQYFAHWTAHAEAEAHRPTQKAWLDRLEIDFDNLRRALEWSLASGAYETGLRMAIELYTFWYARGHQTEGTAALQNFLAVPALAAHTELRGIALAYLGHYQYRRGAYNEALAPLHEALRIGHEVGSLSVMGQATFWLGAVADGTGDVDSAARLMAETISLFEQCGDRVFLGTALANLASVVHRQGDLSRALVLYERATAIYEAMGDFNLLGFTLRHWALAVLDQGDSAQAAVLHRRGLASNIEAGDKQGIAASFAAAGAIELALGRAAQAVRLFGAAEALVESIQTRIIPMDIDRYQRNVALACQSLDPATFEAAWTEGRALPFEQAVALANLPDIAEPSAPVKPAPSAMPDDPSGLTEREREVLRLLAEGLSNDQIAERLVISAFTVRAHLRAIYGKLGVSTRSAATRYALENHLV